MSGLMSGLAACILLNKRQERMLQAPLSVQEARHSHSHGLCYEHWRGPPGVVCRSNALLQQKHAGVCQVDRTQQLERSPHAHNNLVRGCGFSGGGAGERAIVKSDCARVLCWQSGGQILTVKGERRLQARQLIQFTCLLMITIIKMYA